MAYQVRYFGNKVKRTLGIYSLVLLSGCALLSDYASVYNEPCMPGQQSWDAFNAQQKLDRLRFDEAQHFNQLEFDEQQRSSREDSLRTMSRLQEVDRLP